MWAERPPELDNRRNPAGPRLLAEMFGTIQARFGGMTDEALWAMTPRNFYAKLQQAERQHLLWMADIAQVAYQTQAGADPRKWIAALRQ